MVEDQAYGNWEKINLEALKGQCSKAQRQKKNIIIQDKNG